MKIGTKLFAGFFSVIFLLLVVGGVAYFGLDGLGKAIIGLDRDSDVSNLAAEVEAATDAAEANVMKYILYNKDEYLKAIEDLQKKMLDKIQQIEKLTNQEDIRKGTTQLKPLMEKFYVAGENIQQAITNRTKADDERRQSGLAVDAAIEAMEKYLQKVIDRNDDDSERALFHFGRLEKAARNREAAGRHLRDVQIRPEKEQRDKAESARAASMDSLLSGLQIFLDQPLNDEEREKVNALVDIVKLWGNQGKACKELTELLHAREAECYAVVREITEVAGEMNALTTQVIDKSVADADDLQTYFVSVILIVSLFAVIVAVVIAFVLTRVITSGIKEMVDILYTVGVEGDLSHNIPPHRLSQKEEIGQLAVAVQAVLEDCRDTEHVAGELANGNWTATVKVRGEKDAMNIKLAEMIDKINASLKQTAETVNQVAEGAAQVSSASQSLSQGATESAASLEEISASMSEISSQTKTNAENAGQARDLAQSASKAATDGQHAMQDMTQSMERITHNSTEIQRVIKVIDDIAFQTNLLALNAAVEAARAGQHGKGFAVVAEEVRNLAARSAKAARETTDLIAKSGHEIEHGGEVTANTAAVLNTIVEQVKQTTDLVAGIAIASNEQAQGVNQVTVGLQQIDSVTQQNTAAAEESASAASEMQTMATNLQTLVAQFKLK